MVLDALIVFGIGVLGMAFYAGATVYKKVREDRKFDTNKFFGHNKRFWLVGVALHLMIALITLVIPDIIGVIDTLGFSVESDTPSGWFLFGISLAIGTDKTKITGTNQLNRKTEDTKN